MPFPIWLTPAQRRVERKLDALIGMLQGEAGIQRKYFMALKDDIAASLAAGLAQAKANTDELASIKTVIDTSNAAVAALSAQITTLQAQVAAGGTVSDADLQGLKDGADAIVAELAAQKTAEDTLANTPAAFPGT